MRSIVVAMSLCATLVPASVAAGALERVAERGGMRIGVGYQAPPMNFIDDQGNHTGFDVDIAKAVARQLGHADPEIVKVNNKTRVSFLATGQVDLVVASMNHTLSRDEVIDFSVTYLSDGKRILAAKGRYRDLKDFVGKRIAVVQGSNAGTAVRDALIAAGDPDPQIVSFQDNALCFLALKTGKVDGYTNDTVIMVGTSGGSPEFEVVGDIYSPTYFSMGVPENDSKWRDAVNFALREMHINGVYESIYQKWFGRDGAYPLPERTVMPEIWPK